MRTWGRVPTDTICGGCGATIKAQSPALSITLPGVKRVRIRCENCEGLAPADLPASVELSPELGDMAPIRKLAHQFGGKIWKHG